MQALMTRYRGLIFYAIFGVLTTIVNIALYFIARQWWHLSWQISYVFAWFWAVFFAYLSNRKLVFGSEATSFGEFWTEIWRFYAGRIASGILGWVILAVGVKWLHGNDQLWNVIQNGFVIASNYVIAKLFVFQKEEKR
ncbi:MAG TPA: GtrA family protein [Lactobacillaceae bacterium]|jgi:putative flippase GtrA